MKIALNSLCAQTLLFGDTKMVPVITGGISTIKCINFHFNVPCGWKTLTLLFSYVQIIENETRAKRKSYPTNKKLHVLFLLI